MKVAGSAQLLGELAIGPDDLPLAGAVLENARAKGIHFVRLPDSVQAHVDTRTRAFTLSAASLDALR